MQATARRLLRGASKAISYQFCTDNAAMIGFVATQRLTAGETSPLSTDIDPNLRLVV